MVVTLSFRIFAIFGATLISITFFRFYKQDVARRHLSVPSDSFGPYENRVGGGMKLGSGKTYHLPKPLGHIELDHSPLDLKVLETKAKNLYSKDPDAPMLLSMIDELITRKMPQWFSDNSGHFVKNANVLRHRLEFVRKHYSRDCRRTDLLLYICTITKLDAIHLQEWLVWQLVVVGVTHILVYMNDPRADNTEQVLYPFVEAGFVTAINFTGTSKQSLTYNHCIDIIKKKSCHYNGPDVDPVFMNVPNCKENENYDIHSGKDRNVWVAGFDTDEFPVDATGACVVDALFNFTNVNGLMLPWQCFGHDMHYLTPPGELVIEAYTTRTPRSVIIPGENREKTMCKFGKAFNKVSHITEMIQGHDAAFKDKHTTVDEFGNYSRYYDVYTTTHPGYANPRLRLHHYLTKSVEHLMKKYLRGQADRSSRRDLSQIMRWLRGFATDWQVEDRTAVSYVPMIRAVLFGPSGTGADVSPYNAAIDAHG